MYEIEEKKARYEIKGFFFVEPWLVYLIVNVSALILLSALGIRIGIAITENYSTRLFGEHCNSDSECTSGMNFVCLKGVCNCSLNYYFVSPSIPCRKLSHHKSIDEYIFT